MKNKSAFEQFKPFFHYGKKFQETNPKAAVAILFYAVNELTKRYKADKTIFSDQEIKDFKAEVSNYKSVPEGEKMSQTEYIEFLDHIFANVDEEDKYGEVTLETSVKFRMTAVLFDVLNTWEPLTDEQKEKKKYCNFKALNINKSISKGEVPLRGGPEDFAKKKKEVEIKLQQNQNTFEDHTVQNTFNENFNNTADFGMGNQNSGSTLTNYNQIDGFMTFKNIPNFNENTNQNNNTNQNIQNNNTNLNNIQNFNQQNSQFPNKSEIKPNPGNSKNEEKPKPTISKFFFYILLIFTFK